MTTLQHQHTPLILVADDDRSTRIILRLLLQREGYEVVEVENGEQCLNAFAERRPDMVLLDAQMPIMNGFDCCNQLKQLPFSDRIPILMITGLEDPKSVDRAFQSGATDFITKPINALILSRRLRYLLMTSQAEAALRDSEERYRSVVNNLKEIIFQTDLEGKLTFLNPAWESVTGFSHQECIGQKFLNFLCSEEGQPLWVQLQQILQGHLLEYRNEVRFISRNGGFGWIELYASARCSQGGQVMGLSGSLNDITERKDREFLDRLERSAIRVLAESATLEAAIPNLLHAVGWAMECDYGEFWIKHAHNQDLECVQTWHSPAEESRTDFETCSPFSAEFIQNSWHQAESSLAQQRPFEALATVQFEMQSTFSFPILSGYECLGIVVFVREFYPPIDTNLLKRLESIGSQMGAFMMRKLAEKELQKHHDLMRSELNQAAQYIRTLLPQAFDGKMYINHFFMPSNELGGDIFDYYWLDPDHLVVYLVDVAGHGVQSALLSISVLNVLRSRSLQNADFYQPASVLSNLNRVFQMGEKGDDYFTIWYGVYNQTNRTLAYASAGHPPALVIPPNNVAQQLNIGGIAIGLLPDMTYKQGIHPIELGSCLYVFSDGVYEVIQANGQLWEFDAFVELMRSYQKQNGRALETVFEQVCDLTSSSSLEDDFSLIQIDISAMPTAPKLLS